MNGYVDDTICDGLFDNIEDLLDFSTDDEVLGMMENSVPSGGGDGGAVTADVSTTAAVASFPSTDREGCRVSATPDEETRIVSHLLLLLLLNDFKL